MAKLPDLTFIPSLSISPCKIVSYTTVEGLNRAKRVTLPKLDVSQNIGTPFVNTYNGIDPVMRQTVQDWVDARNKERNELISQMNLKEKKYKSVISFAAAKRIKEKINWFYCMADEKRFGYKNRAKFRLNMFTVTLAAKQMHSDAFIKKKMLNRLLEDMRDKYGLKSYMWRAEIQTEKTDNIHFHITTNIYIDKLEFRAIWNRIQAKYGYIDEFEKKYKHRDPNGTDVHRIEKVQNLAAYLCKYMAKDTNGARPITGRQWFLSENLSKLKSIQLIEYPELSTEISAFTTERKKYFKKYDYASVSYADIFTSDLAKYPCLAEIKQTAFDRYKHLVN